MTSLEVKLQEFNQDKYFDKEEHEKIKKEEKKSSAKDSKSLLGKRLFDQG